MFDKKKEANKEQKKKQDIPNEKHLKLHHEIVQIPYDCSPLPSNDALRLTHVYKCSSRLCKLPSYRS